MATEMATEIEYHTFEVEASAIGLIPGQWPDKIASFSGVKGNGMHFNLRRLERKNGELMFVVYRQELGCTEVIVWND